MGDLPRIDVARRAMAETADLLRQCIAEIDDLHAMAYERRVGGERVNVRVSVTDWALDRQGDPVARAAYRRLLGAVLATYAPVNAAARDAVGILRQGDRPARVMSARTASAAEVLAAIEAQARRASRGEYTPHRVYAQPDPGAPLPDAPLEAPGSPLSDDEAASA